MASLLAVIGQSGQSGYQVDGRGKLHLDPSGTYNAGGAGGKITGSHAPAGVQYTFAVSKGAGPSGDDQGFAGMPGGGCESSCCGVSARAADGPSPDTSLLSGSTLLVVAGG